MAGMLSCFSMSGRVCSPYIHELYSGAVAYVLYYTHQFLITLQVGNVHLCSCLVSCIKNTQRSTVQLLHIGFTPRASETVNICWNKSLISISITGAHSNPYVINNIICVCLGSSFVCVFNFHFKVLDNAANVQPCWFVTVLQTSNQFVSLSSFSYEIVHVREVQSYLVTHKVSPGSSSLLLLLKIKYEKFLKGIPCTKRLALEQYNRAAVLSWILLSNFVVMSFRVSSISLFS